jgi:hypothetical protein
MPGEDMAGTWIVVVEKAGKVVAAEKFTNVTDYLAAVFRAARLVDEKLPGAIVSMLTPDRHGVVGSVEWRKEGKYLTLEESVIKSMADAARHAGLTYER